VFTLDHLSACLRACKTTHKAEAAVLLLLDSLLTATHKKREGLNELSAQVGAMFGEPGLNMLYHLAEQNILSGTKYSWEINHSKLPQPVASGTPGNDPVEVDWDAFKAISTGPLKKKTKEVKASPASPKSANLLLTLLREFRTLQQRVNGRKPANNPKDVVQMRSLLNMHGEEKIRNAFKGFFDDEEHAKKHGNGMNAFHHWTHFHNSKNKNI
jgi:hypothetical protein